jgi:hypothetical protein
MKKKMTKAEQIELRATTYREPPKEMTCQECRHAWIGIGTTRCFAIEIRGNPKTMPVSIYGTCDLFQAKKPESTEAKGK